MRLINDLKRIIRRENVDPWKDYIPDTPTEPQPAEEEETIVEEPLASEVVEVVKKKKKRPSYMLLAKQVFILLWAVCHVFPLYVMMGSPIATGILAYVVVNLVIYLDYFMLIGRKKNE